MADLEGMALERCGQLRRCILDAAPGVEEVISYNMPAVKKKKIVVYYAAYDGHIGLYATPTGNEAFREELKNYKTGKGSIQFSHGEPLPEDLIRRIVEYRLAEVDKESAN